MCEVGFFSGQWTDHMPWFLVGFSLSDLYWDGHSLARATGRTKTSNWIPLLHRLSSHLSYETTSTRRNPAENENLAYKEEGCFGQKSCHNNASFHVIFREIAGVPGKWFDFNHTACVCLSIMRQKNKYGNFKFCSLSWYVIYGVLLFFFHFNGNKCYSYIFVWLTLVIPKKLHLCFFFNLMKN